MTIVLDGDPQTALSCLVQVLERGGFSVERAGLSTVIAERGSRLRLVLLGAVPPPLRVEAHAVADREHGRLQLWANPGEAHHRLSSRRLERELEHLVDEVLEALARRGLGGERAA